MLHYLAANNYKVERAMKQQQQQQQQHKFNVFGRQSKKKKEGQLNSEHRKYEIL
jgi:hypothetical protein